MREMDQLLALHCAPTLLGIKPANLIRLSSEQIPRLTAAICEYDRLLSAKGIRLEMLCRCSTSALLLVHSPAQLQALLRRPPQRRMLLQAGSPPSGSLSEQLAHLQKRIRSCSAFPHEVGLFLGYPPSDVEAFQRCQGKGCILCGYWKVYSDEERARHTFQRYDDCRDYLCRRVAAGASIPQLLFA